MCEYKRGDVLIIINEIDDGKWLSIGEVITFEHENSIVYICSKSDGLKYAVGKKQCELLSKHRKRIIDNIIKD